MEEKPFDGGGFGKVYKAKWRNDDVAVKVITVGDEGVSDEVMCEASITISLKHENVIKLFGITKVMGDQLGIVMELAEHGSLDNWIGKIDQDKMTKIAMGIISGLEYVHLRKVIHRDIKPKNILMFGPEDDMIPKISDFGVSKVIKTTAVPKTRVGEELYMAPEMKMFNRYDFSADVFSLAITLFEIFSEHTLQQSPADVTRYMLQVHSGRIGDIPQTCKVPKYLHNILKRGWNETPEERPKLSEYRSVFQSKQSYIFIAYYSQII